jgi:hypothetical protein
MKVAMALVGCFPGCEIDYEALLTKIQFLVIAFRLYAWLDKQID